MLKKYSYSYIALAYFSHTKKINKMNFIFTINLIYSKYSITNLILNTFLISFDSYQPCGVQTEIEMFHQTIVKILFIENDFFKFKTNRSSLM